MSYTYDSITVRKIAPHVGAEIDGVDLSRPVTGRQLDEVHRALAENLVIFFRDQTMGVQEQRAFGQLFGELLVHPASPNAYPGLPDVMVLHADESSFTVDGENWHTDVSCAEVPPMGSVLHLTEVPDVGGDTMFASMYAAYDALSDRVKTMLDGMTATHDGEKGYRGKYINQPAGKVYPKAEHPVVCTHPVTGRKLLFVNRGFTSRINQLTRSESDAVLEFLFRHIETPLFHCRFSWRLGSVALWDNLATQHRALWDYFPNVRHGHRVTIRGERPVFQTAA
ncbi:MAG: taurine dioxygenase, 2-oxoglutarate-dependent [Rubritepida sp.]|nr:taurine dioxygenase, 2-oxoglutarate-dependent [Rubritepida sp.]